MNPIYWYGADFHTKHKEIRVTTTYHSLTGNEWWDLLIVAALLLLPVIFLIWLIERKYK